MTIGLPTPPTPPPASGTGGRMVIAATLVALVGGGAAAAWWLASKEPAPAAMPTISVTDSSARAPIGTRIVVRVVNGSGVRGLARLATAYLRDFGYDVVDYDSERDGTRVTTEIVVHTGHRDWASRIQRALGVGTVAERPDSLRYVDLTVIVGRDWQPAPQPLRP